MRRLIRDYVARVAAAIDMAEPIYEFGSYLVEGQEVLADLRQLFPGKDYVGCDMRSGPGVDRVQNLRQLDLPDESVGSVLMMDTLEHVEYPRAALREVYRVLRKDGIVIMSSVMNFPIHDYPSDYWRFTPEAFRSLLGSFAAAEIEHAGYPLFPHTVVALGLKGAVPDLGAYRASVAAWKLKWRYPDHRWWVRLALGWAPPAVLETYWDWQDRHAMPLRKT